MFNHTMKHVDTFPVNLPIAFPYLIPGIILKQHPKILHPQDSPHKKVGPLTLDKKFFMGIDIPKIMVKH